jgi:rhamnopyranosyl-N-acetylglucosaminyl-diphospho-decaprenol beta-1,3/1,4-galactofuranosyltransferase
MVAAGRGVATERNEPCVFAIVLTYSAPGALVACVRALMTQSVMPDEVLIVDNDGEPAAERSLAAADVRWDRVRVIREPENTGPAGGHATGLREFLASDRDLAWVMDDDCIPEGGCLEALLNATGERREGVFVFPDWIAPSGEITRYPAWCGFLISSDVVGRAGLPRSELVWWGEDTEYLMWRIPAVGYPRQHSDAARVRHLMARATEKRPGWKYYYEARNSVYLRLRYRRHPARLARTIGRLLVRVALRENERGRKLRLIVQGTIDGLRGRLGMRVPIVAERHDQRP